MKIQFESHKKYIELLPEISIGWWGKYVDIYLGFLFWGIIITFNK